MPVNPVLGSESSKPGGGGGGTGTVSKINAGAGISVTPATGKGSVTVTNAGVKELVAGTHVTLTPATGKGNVTVTVSGTSPTGTAGGDLHTTYPNPKVVKIQGHAVASTAPTANQVLVWTATTSEYKPSPVNATKIQGRTVVTTAPTNGQVYTWTNGSTEWKPATPTHHPTGTAGGDLHTTYPNPKVVKIQGRTVSATTPTATQVYAWTATTSEWKPKTVGGGGGGTVTSIVAGSHITVTPATGKGIVTVSATTHPTGSATGDLATSYPDPKVVKLQGRTVVSTAPTNGQVLTWTATTAKWYPHTPTGAVSSVFTRTGTVTAQPGDYTAGQVTGAANKTSTTIQTFNAEISAPALVATLTGTSGRFVGSLSAAPGSGTYLTGDYGIGVHTTHAVVVICKAGGSPGTWVICGLKVAMGGGVTGTSTNATIAKVPSGALVAGTNVTLSTTAGKAKINASGSGGTTGTTIYAPIQMATVAAATASVLPNSPAYTNSLGTLTATTTGSLYVDTFLVANTTRVGVTLQASGLQNGIYVVTTQGSGSSKWKLTRATTMNTSVKCTKAIVARVVHGTNFAGGAVVFQPATWTTFTLGTTAIDGFASRKTDDGAYGAFVSKAGIFSVPTTTAIHIRPGGSTNTTNQLTIGTLGQVLPKGSEASFSTKTCVTILTPHTIASGTPWRPTNNRDTEITFGVTLAGTLTMSYAPTSSGTAHVLFTSLAVVAGTVITKRIPASWYVKVTLSTATVTTAKQQTV